MTNFAIRQAARRSGRGVLRLSQDRRSWRRWRAVLPGRFGCAGRIYVGPYLTFEPQLSLVLEDNEGVCGYALAALDSRDFYARYDCSGGRGLCERFPSPSGDPAAWTRAQTVHSWYHQPDYFCPQPYEMYPSHMHIDLLERARGRAMGRRMMERQMAALRERGSPGAHLAVRCATRALWLLRTTRLPRANPHRHPPISGTIYLGKTFSSLAHSPWSLAPSLFRMSQQLAL